MTFRNILRAIHIRSHAYDHDCVLSDDVDDVYDDVCDDNYNRVCVDAPLFLYLCP